MSQKGAGHRGAAQALGHERQVEQLEPGSAELLGDRRAAEPHLDEGLPQIGVVTGVAVEDLAHPRERALVLRQLANGLQEQLLLFRDVEFHGYLLLCAAWSRGSPRPRSPMMLR